MSFRRRLVALGAIAATTLLAAACADDPAETAATNGTSPTAPPPPAAPGDASSARAGAWAVGDAGVVEFRLEGGALRLAGTAPAAGWTAETVDDGPDAVEVGFARGADRWTFRAALTGGELAITMNGRRRGAPAGPYGVGDAGTVVAGARPGGLTLASASTGGWSVSTTTRNERGEVVLRKGPATWRLAAVGRGNLLDLDWDFEVRGPAGG
ncbi:MAG: hypothetical protein QOD86_1725 [Miltoncostaeaceae bacterium]|nr:hypothetical protein [Miltoncostaeaceae bacterium]